MRILQVHNRYRSATPGGEDRVVDQEAAALADRGHAIERFERFNDDIDSWPVWRRAMLPGQVLWSESARRSLTHAIDRFRPDVVHIHNTFPQLSPSVLYACRARQVPAVVTLHNFRLMCASSNLFRDGHVCHDCVGRLPVPAVRHGCYDSSMRTLPVAAANVAHARAWRTLPSAFIVISDYQRRVLAPFALPSERVFVKANLVPSAIAPDEPVATLPIVVFAGRLGAEKGADVLMEAWNRFAADRDPGLRLVIAGTGPLQDQVTEWSARHPSVELVGLLSRRDCAALIASARAAIIASACEETFGLVAVEAMACGVPPVAPAFGSFPELVRHERDGVLYQPGDADALARVFRDVEADPNRFAAYGREAREVYESRFDPDVNIGELLAIYEHAVARPAHAPAS